MVRKVGRLTVKGLDHLPPGRHSDGGNLYLNVSRSGSRSWLFMYRWRGKQHEFGLGSARYLSLSEAREVAAGYLAKLARGIEPERRRDRALAATLEERVIAKARSFLDDCREPAGYLYRHYHPSGDLLYVGMSMQPLKRQKAHAKEAKWRDMICRILIEPFATRDELVEAEQEAIRNEFPKFNGRHNRARHPYQELRKPDHMSQRPLTLARS